MGAIGIHQEFGRFGRSLGGMYRKPADMAAPPHWLLYAKVPDLQAAGAAVKAEHGQVLNGPLEVPGGDLVAQILDPQGAAFALHQTKGRGRLTRSLRLPGLSGSVRLRAGARLEAHRVARVNRRLLFWLAALFLAFVAAVAGLVTLLVSPRAFLRLLAFSGVLLTLASTVSMLRSWHRAQRLSATALVVSAAVSLASLVLYGFFVRLHLGVLVWLGALFCGTLIGAAWGLLTPLRLTAGVVERCGGLWSLALWGGLLALHQLLVVVLGGAPRTAGLLPLAGTAIVAGQTMTLLVSATPLRSRRA